MPFTAINVVNGTTPVNATWGNNAQIQYTESSLSFEPDQFTAGFVISGYICYKDASTANKLDVTNGTAYLLQTDGTTRQRSLATSTQTTSAISSTYNLYLQPDGTWYWSTSNSPATNSLYIATVTTDASGNILVVTDKRTLVANAFPNLVGTLELPAPLGINQTQNATLAGSVNGTVTFGKTGALLGDYNQAALFDGSTGWVSCPTTGLPTSGNITLECWVNMASFPTNGIPVCLGNGSGGTTFYLEVQTTGKVTCGNATTNLALSGAISTNVWHHLVATYDGTNARCYVDGSLTAGPTALSVAPTYGTMAIGQMGNSSFWFPGTIDEVAAYNTTLSAARISAHFSAATSTTTGAYAAAILADSPLRYYRLSDAVGSGNAADTIAATLQAIIGPDGSITTPGLLNVNGGGMNFGPLVSGSQSNIAYSSGNSAIAYVPPLAGGAAEGHYFFTWSGSSGATAFSVGGQFGGANTWVAQSGAVGQVAGQATAGGFGVPVVVSQTIRTHVTATTLQTITTYTPSATGFYRINVYFTLSNGTSGQLITASCAWYDIDRAASQAEFLTTQNLLLNAVTSLGNGGYYCNAVTVYAGTTSAILVKYQDPANTPSDFVTVIIERLT